MSLHRHEDEDGRLCMDDEARDYMEQLAGVDTARATIHVPCADIRCILSRGHEGPHYAVDDDGHETRWNA
jgi:hypothetical protein